MACATSTKPAYAKRTIAFTVGFDRNADVSGAGARHGVEGRPDVCGSERLPDAPGTGAERCRAARRVCLVADRQSSRSVAATASTGRRCSSPASVKRRWARLGYTATTTYLSSTDGNRTPANSLSDPFPSGITTPQGNSLGLATGAGGVIDFVDQNSRPGQVQQYSIDYCAPGARRHRGRRSATRAAGRGTCRSAARSDSTVNINQLDPQYLALGPALLDLVANPFFGNAAFGNLVEFADHRPRSVAAAVSAVRPMCSRIASARSARNTTR